MPGYPYCGQEENEFSDDRAMALAHVREGARHILARHLVCTGALAGRYAGRFHLRRAGRLLGLLHDLGKYSAAFQEYILSAAGMSDCDRDEAETPGTGRRALIDHSTAGAQRVWRLPLVRKSRLACDAAQFLALCAASHHGGLMDCLDGGAERFGDNRFLRRMDKPEAEAHAEEAWAKADAGVRRRVEAILADPALLTEIGAVLTKLREGAGSKVIFANHCGLLARLLFSCLIDADRSDTVRFMRGGAAPARRSDWDTLIGRLERRLGEFPAAGEVNAVRALVSGECLSAAGRGTGLYTLTVPTGGGKTLAALRFALHHAREHGLERVFCIAPFISIIDQNAEVARRVLDPEGEGGIVLEHHSNLTPDHPDRQEKLLAETWDAPVIHTTLVQVLDALFGVGTRGARRMHRLGRSVLIFDEIQCLPLRLAHLFANAVNFLVRHCGSTVILCTATQPLLDRIDDLRPGKSPLGAVRRSENGEIMSDPPALFARLRRVEPRLHLEDGGLSHAGAADLAVAEVRRAGNCLMVVNTKASARELYRLCRERADFDVFHLSTAMCPAHRRRVLAEAKARLDPAARRPVLVVSTQLIEAGIDISFASVIRSLAGLDSIAQAAGRCNRNREAESGLIHVVKLREENLKGLEEIVLGQDVAGWTLRDYVADPAAFDRDPFGPALMECYYRRWFKARRDEMAGPLSDRDGSLLDLLSTNAAVTRRLQEKGGAPQFLTQSFKTAAGLFKAIEAETEGILVPYGGGAALIAGLRACTDPAGRRAVLARAQPYTVGVHDLTKVKGLEFLDGGIAILADAESYSEETGVFL
jgi:CRISPR-associated endonuclease/helicase Cas3